MDDCGSTAAATSVVVPRRSVTRPTGENCPPAGATESTTWLGLFESPFMSGRVKVRIAAPVASEAIWGLAPPGDTWRPLHFFPRLVAPQIEVSPTDATEPRPVSTAAPIARPSRVEAR